MAAVCSSGRLRRDDGVGLNEELWWCIRVLLSEVVVAEEGETNRQEEEKKVVGIVKGVTGARRSERRSEA